MSEPRRALLLGVRGGGGEEVFLRDLAAAPPPGWRYDLVIDDHASIPGARARRWRAGVFNRLVHPGLHPLIGVRGWTVDPRFDLVHVHNVPTLLGVPRDVPVVFSAGGGGYPHYLRSYLGWDEGRVARRYRWAGRLHRAFGIRSEVGVPGGIDVFVVFSPAAAEELRGIGVEGDRIRVVPPGFDLPAPAAPPARTDRADPAAESAPLRLLLVGRDPHRKGVDLALAALRTLRAEGHAVELALVGDPSYPGLAGEGVRGVARMDRAELLGSVVAHADVVLVPSRAEGFGFAAVEAMGYGRPVVVAREHALPWIVGDGGLVVDRDDASALADAVRRLVGDAGLRARLGAAGRARFEREFDGAVFRRRMAELYAELCGSRS